VDHRRPDGRFQNALQPALRLPVGLQALGIALIPGGACRITRVKKAVVSLPVGELNARTFDED